MYWFWRYLLRIVGMDKWFRVHGRDPRVDLPCGWCERIRLTTISEVWSIGDPVGYYTRICKECSESCA